MPTLNDLVSDPVVDPFMLHKQIKESGYLTFWGCRIPVSSQFNLQAWQEMLVGYWDVQLMELLTSGLPLDYNRSYTLCSERKKKAFFCN